MSKMTSYERKLLTVLIILCAALAAANIYLNYRDRVDLKVVETGPRMDQA